MAVTDIHPNAEIQNGDDVITGIYVGKIFVPMKPHRGHVAILRTASGRGCGYRVVKAGNVKAAEGAMYGSCYNRLVIRSIDDPRTEDEVLQVAASDKQRLVILDEKGKV